MNNFKYFIKNNKYDQNYLRKMLDIIQILKRIIR